MSKKQPEPQALQSIDPSQLAHVAGGAARASSSGGSSEITAALTGVMDALSSLKNQQSGGMDPMSMMMMMMMGRWRWRERAPGRPAAGRDDRRLRRLHDRRRLLSVQVNGLDAARH
jgi:hypothetical protein